MGMAASQQRFLGLTARKSNVEYQGQQVNQKRTNLSNQSANLLREMMTMNPPTPPSVENYTMLTYTFTNDSDTSDDTTYKFSSYKVTDNTVELEYDRTVPIMKNAGKSLTYSGWNGSKFTSLQIDGKDITDFAEVAVSSLSDNEKEAIKNTSTANWNSEADKIYKFTYDKNTYYVSQDTFDNYMKSGSGSVDTWKKDETKKHDTASLKVDKFSFNDSGRLTSITTATSDDNDDNGLNFTKGHQFSLNITKVKDEDAFEQANRDYEYEKNLYEKRCEEINAKTEIIQKQDKNLELELKNLDTEQNAIQTELEAVTKVIDKNIEDTFKTFA